MINFLKQLLNWIYYEKCYFCRKPASDNSMCTICLEEVTINLPISIKQICGLKVYSASKYENNIKKLIRGLKYHNKRKLAKPFAQILYKFWKTTEFSEKHFEIVPVPLFSKRKRERGYNHVELLCNEFSKLTGYQVNTEILKRIKNTKPQYKMTLKQRSENLKDAFNINIEHYKGKNLLIIDDICTSGATIEEIIKTFKKYNIHNLYVIVGSNP